MSRADRVAARLAEPGARPPARHRTSSTSATSRATPARTGSRSWGPARAASSPTSATSSRRRRRCGGSTARRVPRDLRLGLGEGWPEGPVRLGFEDQHVSVRAARLLRETLPDRVELVPAGGLVEAERAIKEPGELAAIRAAAALTDEVYEWVAEQRRRGADGARDRDRARARDARPRGRAGVRVDRRRRASTARCRTRCRATCRSPAGVLITLDIGARVDGYCSDCTRTWATGELPDDLAEIHATVLAAQEAGVAAVAARAGRARGRRGRARRHRGGRARRALRPRPRPRGRARDPRGAAAGADRRDAAGAGQVVTVEPGRLRPGPRRGADRGPRAW